MPDRVLYNAELLAKHTGQVVTQVALLSQTDRAMLRVIKYFAKSLKVIRNDTAEYIGVCKSLLVFHSIVRIS